MLAQCVSHPQGDARFLPYSEKRKPVMQGEILVTLVVCYCSKRDSRTDMETALLCVSAASVDKPDSKLRCLQVKLHELDRLSPAQRDMNTLKCSPVSMFEPHANHIYVLIVSHSACIPITND